MTVVGRWNYAARTAVLGSFVVLIGWGAWQVREMTLRHERELASAQDEIDGLQAQVEEKVARIGELEAVVADQQRQIEELQEQVKQLEAALRLLKVDHRLARLKVVSQRPVASAAAVPPATGAGASASGGPGPGPGPGTAGPAGPDSGAGVETDVSFQELDAEGRPIGREQRFTLRGRVAYVDALVIKFADDYVEQGDALRGSSLCLFRRLFGEFQKPSEGFPLDTEGARPAAYSGDDADPGFESKLWKRFWDYANDPAGAEAAGVRALHGEAPYIELRPGRSYLVELRASGGLSLRAE